MQTQRHDDNFVENIDEVISAERPYIEQRRQTLHVDPATPLTGIAISGGGIRSATFALGVLQTMAEADRLKDVDYLSTVSGGGYIGSCLTSLLTVTSTSEPKQTSKGEAGLGPGTFPLTSLRADEGPEFAGLSGRHQMHHLRRGGRYLSEQMRLGSRTLQRLIGTFVGGMLLHLVMFVFTYVAMAATVHGVVMLLTGSDSMTEAMIYLGFQHSSVVEAYTSVDEMVEQIWLQAAATFDVYGPLTGTTILASLVDDGAYRTSAIAGAILGLLSVAAGFLVVSTKAQEFLKRFRPVDRAGQSARGRTEELILKTIAGILIGGSVVLMFLPNWLGSWAPYSSNGHAELYVPIPLALCYALASWLCGLLLESQTLDARSDDRVLRSYLASVRGIGFTAIIITVLFPVVTVALFSISAVSSFTFVMSVVSLGIGGSVAMSTERTSKILGAVLSFLKKHPSMIYGLAALTVLLLPFSVLTRWMMDTFYYRDDLFAVEATVTMIGGSLILMTWLFNANRLSPFRFYRDRIAEAFLRTQRVNRTESGFAETIRTDENLKLADLGRNDLRGGPIAPYHLITAALNMDTAKGLLRADSKSIHFLFSPRYVGSDATGYRRTPDDVTVGDAVAVSGAAASSLAGRYSSFGQRFFSVLFNIRLGQWIRNPRHDVSRNGLWGSNELWFLYLMREVNGNANATAKRVHVSDGGHTGDNLGLLPLLQRQCETIVVIDGEQDKELTFGSFNHAIRLALVELDHRIDINLTEIETLKSSVVRGTVYYRGGARGTIYYVKSSVTKPDEDVNMPEHVENYDRKEPDFPHQSTGDQFFDPEQFEAYRALGEYIGGQLVRKMKA